MERPEGRFTPCDSVRGRELVLVDVPRDLAAEVGGLDIGSPEVDPCPDARFEDLVGHAGEAGEGAALPGHVRGVFQAAASTRDSKPSPPPVVSPQSVLFRRPSRGYCS